MAKTRAQRKAERRAREAEEQKRSGSERNAESRAQHDTQIGVSGDVAEIEAIEAGIAEGASEADLETPDAPHQPSRSDRGARRRHRLPAFLLGRAQESPVARSRDAGPGHRRHCHLRRRRGSLPRRVGRALQLPRQADPLTKGFLNLMFRWYVI